MKVAYVIPGASAHEQLPVVLVGHHIEYGPGIFLRGADFRAQAIKQEEKKGFFHLAELVDSI
jgi:hypothetical protein